MLILVVPVPSLRGDLSRRFPELDRLMKVFEKIPSLVQIRQEENALVASADLDLDPRSHAAHRIALF
jgi:hypothetical protein